VSALHSLYRKLLKIFVPAEISSRGEGSEEMWENGRREQGALPPASGSSLPSPGSLGSSQNPTCLL